MSKDTLLFPSSSPSDASNHDDDHDDDDDDSLLGFDPFAPSQQSTNTQSTLEDEDDPDRIDDPNHNNNDNMFSPNASNTSPSESTSTKENLRHRDPKAAAEQLLEDTLTNSDYFDAKSNSKIHNLHSTRDLRWYIPKNKISDCFPCRLVHNLEEVKLLHFEKRKLNLIEKGMGVYVQYFEFPQVLGEYDIVSKKCLIACHEMKSVCTRRVRAASLNKNERTDAFDSKHDSNINNGWHGDMVQAYIKQTKHTSSVRSACKRRHKRKNMSLEFDIDRTAMAHGMLLQKVYEFVSKKEMQSEKEHEQQQEQQLREEKEEAQHENEYAHDITTMIFSHKSATTIFTPTNQNLYTSDNNKFKSKLDSESKSSSSSNLVLINDIRSHSDSNSSMEQEPYSQDYNKIKYKSNEGNTDEEEDARIYGFATSSTNTATNKSRERLNPGDIVTYFSPMFTAGDKRGLRSAQILIVRTSSSSKRDTLPRLTLSNDELLPSDTRVKRSYYLDTKKKTLVAHPNGLFRAIDAFTVKEDAYLDVMNYGPDCLLVKEKDRIGRVIENAMESAKSKMKAEGLGAYIGFLNKVGKESKKDIPQYRKGGATSSSSLSSRNEEHIGNSCTSLNQNQMNHSEVKKKSKKWIGMDDDESDDDFVAVERSSSKIKRQSTLDCMIGTFNTKKSKKIKAKNTTIFFEKTPLSLNIKKVRSGR